MSTADTGTTMSVPATHGWLIDLAALVVAVVGTAMCGVSALRASTLPPRLGWAMPAVLPLTPVAGFPACWYLPPGLTMGLLLSGRS